MFPKLGRIFLALYVYVMCIISPMLLFTSAAKQVLVHNVLVVMAFVKKDWKTKPKQRGKDHEEKE